jgi:hypothetical protein
MVKYVMPSGELVSREVSLQVPARGQGEIVLKGGEQQVATTKFRTKKAHGRTIFAVAFDNPPGAPEGSTAVFTGTYMRGTNQAIYYGDVYLVTKTDSASDVIEDAWRGRGVTHKAGFYFEAATR